MVDITYNPTPKEDEILLVLKQESRVNTQRICDRTDYNRDTVAEGIENLLTHGWIAEITEDLYEFVDDPRGEKARLKPGVDPNKETQTSPIDPTEISDEADDSQ